MRGEAIIRTSTDRSLAHSPAQPRRERVVTHSLADSAASRIAHEITSGALPPGQRLPSERDLAVSLGLSRGALREGLRTLESVGLVHARVGQGRFVAMTGMDSPSVALNAWMQLQPSGDIIAVRRLLEPAAVLDIPAARVNETATHAGNLLRQMQQAHSRRLYTRATRFHTEFHLSLIRYGSTRLLRVLLASLIEAATAATLDILMNPDAARASMKRHIAIQLALASGDVPTAAERVAEHLEPALVYSQFE